MLTNKEFEILCSDEMSAAIEANIERQPLKVALDKSINNSHLVATQLKYLQRARKKLPSFFAARAIIPSLSFEQSSSEAVAAAKDISGKSALDLTCGLGVDTFALSKKFERVVSVERDEMLAAAARENFRRLGVSNVEVVNMSAEDYIETCLEHFDWVYVDPDRRAEGRKLVLLEDCSPNILALLPRLEQLCKHLMVKCSPLFDVDEALRLFPGCDVEVLSLNDECKELLIHHHFDSTRESRIGANAIGKGKIWSSREKFQSKQRYIEEPKYLIIPDVALQKSRLAKQIFLEIAEIESDNAYAFLDAESMLGFDAARHLGRVEQIEAICEYEPKRLKKLLAERGIKSANILKRDFPHSTEQILKQLKLREGGSKRLAFTCRGGKRIVIFLEAL